MVYMAGDNSLDGAALKDLAEMARAGFTNAVNVLVQLDRLKDHKTRRFRITKGGGYNKDCIETFGETDTGDPRVLCDFIKWGVKRYPAVRSSKNGKGIPVRLRAPAPKINQLLICFP
jgi:hypothetical protein